MIILTVDEVIKIHGRLIEEKAARIAFGIVNNHAFLDGNKRIGMLSMLMILRLNQVDIKYTQRELIALGLGVADGSIGYDEILDWIISHKIMEQN